MAQLEIVEYRELAEDQHGRTVMAGKEPAITGQQVDFSSGAAASAAFNAETRFIMVRADVDARLAFGTAPTATSSSPHFLDSGQARFIGVDGRHENLKVSAVSA